MGLANKNNLSEFDNQNRIAREQDHALTAHIIKAGAMKSGSISLKTDTRMKQREGRVI